MGVRGREECDMVGVSGFALFLRSPSDFAFASRHLSSFIATILGSGGPLYLIGQRCGENT